MKKLPEIKSSAHSPSCACGSCYTSHNDGHAAGNTEALTNQVIGEI